MTEQILFKGNMEHREKGLKSIERLLKQARLNVELENFDDSTMAMLKEAMELSEKWEVKEKMAEVYEYWGNYQIAQQEFEQGIVFFQKSLDILIDRGEDANEMAWRLYLGIGLYYTTLNDFKSAKNYLDKALELAQLIFEVQNLNIAKTYSGIGVLYFNQDYFFEAIECFQECIRIAKTLSPSPDSFLMKTYQNIATNYLALYNYEKALYFFQKSKIILEKRKPPMHIDFGIFYNNYANLCHRMGDINRAILYAQKSIEVYDYNENMSVVYPCRLLSGIYGHQKEDEKALKYGEKAVAVLLKFDMEKQRATIILYSLLSSIYQKTGRQEKAFSLLERAIQIAKELYGDYSPRLSSAVKNMGEYYMKEEMYDKAEVQFQKALYILNQCEHERLIGSTHIYKSLGILYEETQRFLPAIEAYHKSLLFSTVGYSEQDVYNYPFVDLKSMNFEIKYEVDSWLELFLSKAHTFFKYYCFQTQNLKDLKAAFRGYEVAFRFLNQVRQSFQSNQSKLRIIKAINQKLFQVIPATYLLFEVSQEKRYLNDAFKFAEKNKAYLILNDKQEKNAKQAADLPTALLEQEKKLQMNLTSLQKNIQAQKQKGEQGNTEKLQKLQTDYFNAYNEFEELRKQFESNYPDYYLQKYSVETVSIPNLQSTLQENQTVLSYFIGEEQIYLFVITSDEYEVFALDKPDNWTDLIQKYLQSIKIHQKAQFQQLSFDLYQILLQEAMHHVIAPFKEEPKQVFIIPHAELHYLPFETLIISEASTSMPYKDMDYLLNYCQISYHYSATLLHLDLQKQEMKEEQAPAEITFTGFAPVYTSSSNAQKQALETLQTEYATAVSRSEAVRSDGTWMPLLHSKIEVENIAQLFEEKGLQSQAFLYETANKSNLEEQIGNSRFVLIAAHGIVNDEYPELSGLVLAENTMDDRRRTTNVVENSPSFEKHGDIWNGEEERNVEEMTVEDCILNMKEVAMIPMKADLVVLSSCESGIGELHKGEGMMAINRGFLASGAKNVVSTLFKVNDRASSELTQLLFANILKGESYSIALQKAKLELLKKKKDVSPKMWSGFVLFGKGK